MDKSQADKVLDRRDFPRLKAAFAVRYAVCGNHGREVPGFTNDLSLGGISFVIPDAPRAAPGDHLTVEILVPGFKEPLYFLGQVLRVREEAAGTELAVRFDWLGKSDSYKEKLTALIDAHVQGR